VPFTSKPVCTFNFFFENITLAMLATFNTLTFVIVFAFWMLTYDAECMESLAGKAAEKIKKFLTSETKVEKVVRLSLVVLQGFLKSKALTEDLASNGLLEVVQSLGYEKYRDNDLYEQIRALGQSIQSKRQCVTGKADCLVAFDRSLCREMDANEGLKAVYAASEFSCLGEVAKGFLLRYLSIVLHH